MTLRIGVAGHRRLPSDALARLRDQIQALYNDIYLCVRQLANTEQAAAFYVREFPQFRIVSSLAEGADRLCIEPDIIPFEHQLACILPFLREEYANDFLPNHSVINTQHGTLNEYNALLERISTGDTQAPIIELDGDPEQRSSAYQRCSQLLVEHCDIMIAVYDGDNRSNRGTANTVNSALAAGIPILHISTLDNAITLHPSNRFGQSSTALSYDKYQLEKELRRVLLFDDILTSKHNKHKQQQDIQARFQRYHRGDNLIYRPDIAVDFDNAGPIQLQTPYINYAAKAFLCVKKWLAKPLEPTLEPPFEKTAPPPHDPDTQQHAHAAHWFYAAYLRADRLANFYANIHRSTFILIYCFGAAALITAAVALAFRHNHGLFMFGLISLELLLLGAIYWLYKKDHHHQYHGRWLEYRYLAEYLRPMVYLVKLGETYPLMRIRDTREYLGRELVGHHSAGRSWLYIYTETIIRAAGFNHFRMDQSHKEYVAQQANNYWLEGQINYHSKNASTLQFISKRLEKWSFTLFIATVIAVLIKLFIVVTHLELLYPIATLAGFATAILPILASLCFAIGNHAEFDISAQRSLSIRAYLISQHTQWVHKGDITAAKLAKQLHQIADMTIEEATEWLEIYEVKEAEPA